jgi:hypothetical protein
MNSVLHPPPLHVMLLQLITAFLFAENLRVVIAGAAAADELTWPRQAFPHPALPHRKSVTLSPGMFSYIPDSSMIGTVFCNFVANEMCPPPPPPLHCRTGNM